LAFGRPSVSGDFAAGQQDRVRVAWSSQSAWGLVVRLLRERPIA
jgi:hypothetical protein